MGRVGTVQLTPQLRNAKLAGPYAARKFPYCGRRNWTFVLRLRAGNFDGFCREFRLWLAGGCRCRCFATTFAVAAFFDAAAFVVSDWVVRGTVGVSFDSIGSLFGFLTGVVLAIFSSRFASPLTGLPDPESFSPNLNTGRKT